MRARRRRQREQCVYVNARKPERAIPVLLEALELAPELDLVHQQLGHAYLQSGQSDQAIRAFEAAAKLSGVRDSAHLAYAYAAAGERDQARRMLDLRLRPGEHHNVLPFHVVMVYAALGEPDAAFNWLGRGYAERASFMDGVKRCPPERLDARFRRGSRTPNPYVWERAAPEAYGRATTCDSAGGEP